MRISIEVYGFTPVLMILFEFQGRCGFGKNETESFRFPDKMSPIRVQTWYAYEDEASSDIGVFLICEVRLCLQTLLNVGVFSDIV